MQVDELYHLTTWIEAAIVGDEIAQKYQRLHQVLNRNAQPNQQKQPFENEKEELLKSLKKLPLTDLSLGQMEVLDKISIAPYVGSDGIVFVEDALYRNALDVASAAQALGTAFQSISQGIQWAEETKTHLSKIIDTEEVAPISDSVLLRVHFEGKAELSNLTEFKNWGKTWWEIGRGIAMARDEAPESVKVVGASKGSIIISLLSRAIALLRP
jgi:hypothetical protein